MRRTAIATGLTLVTGLAINYATQLGPAWTRNPWVVWPLAAVLVVLTIVAVVAERRPGSPEVKPVLAGAARLDSLRPPSLDVQVRGRDAELARLEDLVNRPQGRFAVICGPGGAGKTTLAAEAAERARRFGVTGWWVRFRDPESFAAQLAEIAETLGVSREPGRSLPDLVWSALTARSRWLLVIDNLDRPQQLSPGEPLAEHRGWVREGGGGLLLITSRDTDSRIWGHGAELLTVDTLSTEDAAVALLDVAPAAGTSDQARALAARLGGFPLALDSAGRALAQSYPHRTFDAFREALDTELGDTLAAPHHGPVTEYQQRALLRYTWELSLDQLAEEGQQLARPVLRMVSLAADAPLPCDLITSELLGGNVTRAAVYGAVAGLHRYGLIDIRTNPIPCVNMHPLVREINALLLAEEADTRSWQHILDQILLTDADRTADCGHAGWVRAHLLAPHLAPILTRLDGDREAVLSARYTLDRVADALKDAGNADSRLPLLRAVLEAELTILGPDHRYTLWSRHRLAVALADLGDFGRAVELHEQTLADRERLLPPDHLDILASRNSLAIALRGLGESERAAQLLEQALADYERLLGLDHSDTLWCRNNFALVLVDLGEFKRAAELHERNLTDRERVLPPDHLDILASRTNLAIALRRLGELERAAELLERTLADYERVLGLDHPHALECRNSLAICLYDMGELRRAVELHERTLAGRERVLPPGHLDIVASRNNLAKTLAALERERRSQRGRVFRKRRQ